MGENQCQLSSPILRSKETATSKQIENRNSIPPSFPPKSRGTVTVKEGLDMCSYRPQALKTVQALTRAKKERSMCCKQAKTSATELHRQCVQVMTGVGMLWYHIYNICISCVLQEYHMYCTYVENIDMCIICPPYIPVAMRAV